MAFELHVERRGAGGDSEDARRIQCAEVDILRTMAVYCHAMDYGEAEVWAECFTEDGVYRATFPNGDSREVVGRRALAAYAGAHEGPPKKYPKHMSWAHVIEIDGASATATGMFVVLNEGPTGPIIEVYGRYGDELHRGANGVWRFSSRTSHVEAVAATFKAAAAPQR
jgi:hypothetical protein